MVLIVPVSNTTPDAIAINKTANTYTSLVEADEYHEIHLYGDEWSIIDGVNVESASKEKALLMATRILNEKITWVGVRSTPSQSLAWGRQHNLTSSTLLTVDGRAFENDEVPMAIKNATSEFARHLLKNDLTEVSDDPSSLSKIKVEGIELSYNKQETGEEAVNDNGVIPLIVQEMLMKWGTITVRKSSTVSFINLIRT